MIPNVSFQKVDGNTGVVKPSPAGICAIIAPSSSGTAKVPSGHTSKAAAFAEFADGVLYELAAYVLDVAKKPVVLIRAEAATAGAYSAVSHAGAGTSVASAGGTEPIDDFEVIVEILTGGTVGTAGIVYRYSLDGGESWSGKIALGVANAIVIPRSGVTIALAAGTVLANQTEKVTTTAPQMSNTNLTDALEALRQTTMQYEEILVAGTATATTVATLDLWLSGLEGTGLFKSANCNARYRTRASETEATYRAAMETAFGSAASIRVRVGADGGEVPSARGLVQQRPTALALVARLMASDISVDPAWVAPGPITGFSIVDDRGNPKFHNEALNPGLDDLRLVTLRTIYGREGVFINNAPIISSTGSDYVYAQHARVMNRACELAFAALTTRLSQGVAKDTKTGFILEEEAAEIEAGVQAVIDTEMKGQVSGLVFRLRRDDDLGSNAGATINCELGVAALAYVKKFAVKAAYVRTLDAA